MTELGSVTDTMVYMGPLQIVNFIGPRALVAVPPQLRRVVLWLLLPRQCFCDIASVSSVSWGMTALGL